MHFSALHFSSGPILRENPQVLRVTVILSSFFVKNIIQYRNFYKENTFFSKLHKIDKYSRLSEIDTDLFSDLKKSIVDMSLYIPIN